MIIKLINIILILFIINSINCRDGYLNYNDFKGKSYTVTYDKRAVMINGQRSLFITGSIHYPRFSVGEWDEIFKKMREDGLNLMQLYVFWNYHEEYEGVYNWDDNADLVKFIQLAGENNLFVNMRIGPYVCAEWNLGGLPVWLYMKEGAKMRCNNDIFKREMSKFMHKTIDVTRHLFADRGGPIIMSQIENELWGAEKGYMDYLYSLVNELNVPVPWVMCNGETTNNTINACNGNDCTGFLRDHGQTGRIQIDQPAIWTENEGWFTNWEDYYPDFGGHGSDWACRTTTDLAYSVARWFARGGSYMNYYMYNGGNNMGIWSGSATTTMYADSVNYHSDMTPNEPLHSHLNKLHYVISDIANNLVNVESQLGKEIPLKWWDGKAFVDGKEQVAMEYTYKGSTIAFIESSAGVPVLTLYREKQYLLSPWSILIYDVSRSQLLFNSSNVIDSGVKRTYTPFEDKPFIWKVYKEKNIEMPLNKLDNVEVSTVQLPTMQLKATGGHGEYQLFELNLTFPNANCDYTIGGHQSGAYALYIDGKYNSEVYNNKHGAGWVTLNGKLSNPTGAHRLTIINENFGLTNGISSDMGMVADHGLDSLKICGNSYDKNNFHMRPFLDGEILKVYTDKGAQSVNWVNYDASLNTGGVWYRTQFPTPKTTSNQYIVIDLLGMCRGHVYVNDRDLGRYYLILGRGQDTPTQRYYSVPKDWLKTDGSLNSLVLIEVCNVSDPLKPRVSVVENR